MKKLISILLACVMVLSFGVAAFAASQDLVYDKNATLNASFKRFGNITVKSGATVTVDKGSGFEVEGSIIVENGSQFICNGTGKGEFTFLMRSKNAQISGMDLYFKYEADGDIEVRKVAGGYEAIKEMDVWDWSGGWLPKFKWDSSVQGWCLTQSTSMNLSDIKDEQTQPGPGDEREFNEELVKALALNKLGLLKGSGTKADGSIDFSLEKVPTKLEALVMLIRLLGKDSEAQACTDPCPFSDVPDWGKAYAAYAYKEGLANGTGNGKFGMSAADDVMYQTMVLRALGYSDAAGDFAWNDNNALSIKVGIRSEGFNYNGFLRADMIEISYRALFADVKGTSSWLAAKLANQGVFSSEDFTAASGRSL